eukprot:2459458-Rhodomonas_salina.1
MAHLPTRGTAGGVNGHELRRARKGTPLRTPYATSGTDLAYAAIRCYAIAPRCPVLTKATLLPGCFQQAGMPLRPLHSAMLLRACCYRKIGYGAMGL